MALTVGNRPVPQSFEVKLTTLAGQVARRAEARAPEGGAAAGQPVAELRLLLEEVRARFSLSPANFYDWQREARSFEGMAMYRTRSFTPTGSGTPRTIVASMVGAGFFDIVRGQAAQGRVFRPDEDRPGANVAIVSDAYWRTQLGGRAGVVGQTLRLDGQPFEIVGVMPASMTVAAWGATG